MCGKRNVRKSENERAQRLVGVCRNSKNSIPPYANIIRALYNELDGVAENHKKLH